MPDTRLIASIVIGTRHRREFGDIRSLADSIETVGLLHPIVVDTKDRLIAGQRRLEACKLLRWTEVPVRVVDLDELVEGEFVENACRKDFLPSEVAAIARVLRPQAEQEAAQRQAAGLKQGAELPDRANCPHGTTGRVRDIVAKYAGVSGRTLDKIEAVVRAAEQDPQQYGHLLTDLDAEPRAVHRCYGKLRLMQQETVELPKPTHQGDQARLDATTILHGDCTELLRTIPDASVDVVLTDPPYPGIPRPYGCMSEEDWLHMMRTVITECRRVLKPAGSMVVIIQPNYENVGHMRLWHLEFTLWAAKEMGLIQDCYWWNHTALPLAGCDRKQQMMRPSVKWCVWLGTSTCYRDQDKVLLTPAQYTAANAAAKRVKKPPRPSGFDCTGETYYRTADERGGTTPFNCLPIPGGVKPDGREDHPAATPYELAAWWCRYLLPSGGVVLDPFAGSGTMLAAGIDCGGSKVIGIERESHYIEIATRRIGGS